MLTGMCHRNQNPCRHTILHRHVNFYSRKLSMTIPAALRRTTTTAIDAHGELQTLRHFTRLSQLNFSIDTHFYPLGSCTMKYNPRVANKLASLPGFLQLHPYQNFLKIPHNSETYPLSSFEWLSQ